MKQIDAITIHIRGCRVVGIIIIIYIIYISCVYTYIYFYISTYHMFCYFFMCIELSLSD